jgi:hypothetical protein
MTTENQETTETTETTETESKPLPTERFEKGPKYEAMSRQLAELQREKASRVEAEKTAQREAEEKALRDAGKFDELAAKHAADMEEIKSGHAKEILSGNLTNELLKAGFSNDMFVNGAIQGYDAETHGDVAAYAATLAADEGNKAFLAAPTGRTVEPAPGMTPAGGGSANWDQVKIDTESTDRKTRIDARAKVTAHRQKTGEYPF